MLIVERPSVGNLLTAKKADVTRLPSRLCVSRREIWLPPSSRERMLRKRASTAGKWALVMSRHKRKASGLGRGCVPPFAARAVRSRGLLFYHSRRGICARISARANIVVLGKILATKTRS